MVDFFELKRQYNRIGKEIEKAIRMVFENGRFILGENLEKFEKNFAEYCSKEFCIGVGNGTDAIELALKAYGVGVGDDVITVPNTAIPTFSAIVSSGAKPVFVDVGEDYLIDVKKIEKAITKKTKAIVPVHLYGQACDMDSILKIAKKHKLVVIEDCAQAHGAKYKGQMVPIGETGCFSFYPTKNLGAYGDAGAVVTDSKKIEDKLKLLRHYGQKDRYVSEIVGRNSRLDEIHASMLNVKLNYLDRWIEARRKIARDYDSFLKRVVKIPVESEKQESSYHLYVIRTKDRDDLKKFLEERGVYTEIHYPIPLHLQESSLYLGYKKGEFPNAEKFSKEILSLPIYPELTREEVRKVSEAILEFFEK